jgi:hypothetical protein
MPVPFEFHKTKYGESAAEVQAGMDVKGECMVVYEANGWGLELGGSIDLGKLTGLSYSIKPELALRYKRTKQRMLLTAVCPPLNPLAPNLPVPNNYLVGSLRGFEGSKNISFGAFAGFTGKGKLTRNTKEWTRDGEFSWTPPKKEEPPTGESTTGETKKEDSAPWEVLAFAVDARIGLDVRYSGLSTSYLLIDSNPARLLRDDFLSYLEVVYKTGAHNWRTDAVELINKWPTQVQKGLLSWGMTKAYDMTMWTLGMSGSQPTISVETESETFVTQMDQVIRNIDAALLQLTGSGNKIKRKEATKDRARAVQCKDAAEKSRLDLVDPRCFVEVCLTKHDVDIGPSVVASIEGSLGGTIAAGLELSLKAGVQYKKRSMQSTLEYIAVPDTRVTMTQETHISLSQFTLPWSAGIEGGFSPVKTETTQRELVKGEVVKKEGSFYEFFNRVAYRSWVSYWDRPLSTGGFVGPSKTVKLLPGSGYLVGESVSVQCLHGITEKLAHLPAQKLPPEGLVLAGTLGVTEGQFRQFLDEAKLIIDDLYGESGDNPFKAPLPQRKKFAKGRIGTEKYQEALRLHSLKKEQYAKEMSEQFQLYRNGAVILEAAFAYTKTKKGNLPTFSATRRNTTDRYRLLYPRQKPTATLQALRLRWRASDFQGTDKSPFKLGFSGPGEWKDLLSMNIGLLSVEQAGSERFADICVTEFRPFVPLHKSGDDLLLVPPVVLFLPCNA